MIQVLAVVGPTASGKSALALSLAEGLETEIVSADSMQFYRGMEIGTGAPLKEDLGRVKHHFVGHLNVSEEISAGDFEAAARPVVEALNARGKIAVVAGGSGLYVRALIDGLFDGPSKDIEARARLEREAEALGNEALHARLEGLDPEYASRISTSDRRRIVRALEVREVAGRSITDLHQEHQAESPRLNAVQVALDWPREVLYERINARVDRMIDEGLVAEVSRLVDTGHEADIYRLRSIGYREIVAHLRGESTLAEAVATMKMNTRRYAKRQLTWFKADTRIHWLDAMDGETQSFRVEHVLKLLDTDDARI